MLTIWIHLVAFWNVAVMNCVQPVNWKYCYKINEWLVPELMQGVKIYLDKDGSGLYENEKIYLERVRNSNK